MIPRRLCFHNLLNFSECRLCSQFGYNEFFGNNQEIKLGFWSQMISLEHKPSLSQKHIFIKIIIYQEYHAYTKSIHIQVSLYNIFQNKEHLNSRNHNFVSAKFFDDSILVS